MRLEGGGGEVVACRCSTWYDFNMELTEHAQ